MRCEHASRPQLIWLVLWACSPVVVGLFHTANAHFGTYFVGFSAVYWFFQADVTDLADLQRVHMLYLAQAQQECLMSQSTREVRAIVEPALQCIVDFVETFRYASCRHQSELSYGCMFFQLGQGVSLWSLLKHP